MKKLLGVAMLGVVAVAPANAQTVLCGASDGPGYDVCVLTEFRISGDGSTLSMYAYNGFNTAAYPDASSTESAIRGFVVGLPTGFTYGGNFTANYFNYNLGTMTQTSGAAAFGAVGDALPNDYDGVAIDLFAVGNGQNGISTCEGPTSPATQYVTCERSGSFWSGTWDYMLFTWSINAVDVPMSEDDLEQIIWGFRGQRIGETGESIKCASAAGLITSGAGQICDFDDLSTREEDPTVVPEPATMTLLATGLAGLAAARRRKKNSA